MPADHPIQFSNFIGSASTPASQRAYSLRPEGHRLGQLNLGFSYMEGWGVPQDFILAYMWFNLAAAAAQGETTAAKKCETSSGKK